MKKTQQMKRSKISEMDKASAKPMVVITCSFSFPITSDEAYEYKMNSRGKTAKELRKYMLSILDAAADKCLTEYRKEKLNFDINKIDAQE